MGYFARITKAAAGLALYGLGAYLTIQAGIGLWSAGPRKAHAE